MDDELRQIGEQLRNRLLQFLNGAVNAVMPPGTLPGGATLASGTSDPDIIYDDDGNGIQVEARVWVRVSRPPDAILN
jgi:hypothetical protein